MNYFSIYGLIAVTPVYILIPVIMFLTGFVIWRLRDQWEGIGYNASYSAAFGLIVIPTVITAAWSVLQNGWANVPMWMQDPTIQILVLVVLFIWFVWYSVSTTGGNKRSSWPADLYNDRFILPVTIFLALFLIPGIGFSAGWLSLPAIVTYIMIFFQIVMFAADVTEDRLDQRPFLQHNGVRLPW